MKRLKELADKIAAEHGLEWYQPLNKAEDSAGMTAIDLGNGYSLHHEHSDNGHDIWAVGFKGERAGTFMLKTEDTRRNKPMVVWAGLEKDHRGKGIGTLAYKALAVHYGGIDSDKASSSDDAIKAWIRAGGRQMKLKTQFGKPRYTLDGDKKNPPIMWNEDLEKAKQKLYHGSKEKIDNFNQKQADETIGTWGSGTYFTDKPKEAAQYGPNIYEKELETNNHLDLHEPFDFEKFQNFAANRPEKNAIKAISTAGQFYKDMNYIDAFENKYGPDDKERIKLVSDFIRHQGYDGIKYEFRHPSFAKQILQVPMMLLFGNFFKNTGRISKRKKGDPQNTTYYSFFDTNKINKLFKSLIKNNPSHSLHLINKFEGSSFAPTEFHYSVKSNGKEIGRAIVFDKDPRSIHQAGKTGPSLKDIRLHPDHQGQGHSQGIINKLVETHGPLASDSRGNISPAGAKMFQKYGTKQLDNSYILHGQSLKKSSNIESLIQQAKARLEGVKKVGSQEPRPMIFANKDGKKHAFVTVDPSKKGHWRVTHFINSKPAGHSEAPTFSHAVKVAHESGYNVFKEIPEEELFKAESSADEKIYGKHNSIVHLDPYLIKPQSNDERRGSLTDLHLSGKSPIEWAKGVDLFTPIEATMYADGEIRVSGGHHRQLAAQILHKPVPANLQLINLKNSVLDSQLNFHKESMARTNKQNRENALSQEIAQAKAAPESLAMFAHSFFKKSESLIKAAHPSDLRKIANKTNSEAHEIVDAAPHAIHAPDQTYVDFLNHPKVQKGLGSKDVGGISAKMVHKVGDDTYMAKPYYKKVESGTRAINPHPISGWASIATKNLYSAANIGHLCEDVSFYEHNGIPMTVHKFSKNACEVGHPGYTYTFQNKIKNPNIEAQGKKIAIMDFLTNNLDRHTGNIMFRPNENGTDYSLLAIDHERSFQYNKGQGVLEPRYAVNEMPRSYFNHSLGLKPFSISDETDLPENQTTKAWWRANKNNILNSFNKDIESIKDPYLKNHIKTNFTKRWEWLNEHSHPDHFDFFDTANAPVEMFKERRPKTDYKAIMKNLPENPYKAIGVIDGLFSKKLSFVTRETLADLWNEQVDKMSGEEVGNYLKDIQKTANHPHPKGAYWSLMNRLAQENHRQGIQHLVQNDMIDSPYWKEKFKAVLKLGAMKKQ